MQGNVKRSDGIVIDRRLITILMIVLVQMMGAAMVLPILPLYAKNRFAMEPQTITLLVASFFIAQFIAGPTIGRLSDRYGRLPVLVVSQIGTTISFVMLAFAGNIWILFASRILDGITGGNIIVAQAYVTDITPKERRTQSLGLIFAAFGVGFILGPALGGVLAAAFGEQVPFLIAAIAAGLTTLLTWLTLDETLTPEQRVRNRNFTKASLSFREVRGNMPLVAILGLSFVAQFSLGMLQATFALYGEAVLFQGYESSMVNLGVGLLLATVGLGQVIAQVVLLPRLLKRFDDAWLVVVGALLRSLAMGLYAVALSPWIGAVASIGFAMGGGLFLPPLQSLATRTVSDELRGGVLGLYQSSMSLSTIFSTALSGVLFAIAPTLPYALGAVLFVPMLPLVLIVVRWARAQPAFDVDEGVAVDAASA